ncbi:MAG: hypothetical protein ACLRXC_13260 [[Clostridium] leptum]
MWRNAFDSYYTAKSFEWLPAGAVSMCLFSYCRPFALGGFAADSTAGEYKNSPLNEEFEQSETPCPGLDPAIQRRSKK